MTRFFRKWKWTQAPLRSLIGIVVIALAACSVTPTASPSPTGTGPSSTAAASTATATAESEPVDGPGGSAPPGASPTSTQTPLPAATETVAPSPTATATATPTLAPSPTPTATFQPTVGLSLVADGLGSPVGLEPAPDGSGRLFVIEQIGTISVISPTGSVLATPFLDLRDRMVQLSPRYDERGLLGLAFDPDYAQNGVFYVYYSAPLDSGAPAGYNHTSHISAFTVSKDNPNVADPASERVILRVNEPQANHNGGQIAFGPDGYLYIALGDGGAEDDVGLGHASDWYQANAGGNGQDTTQNLLGSILRIAVDGSGSYTVPDSNPFVGNPSQGLPEIWAYGLRNPYRFSFDSGGEHGLFAGDVGQNLWEEVDIVRSGGNYGWNVKEGSHCFSPSTPNRPPASCPSTDPQGKPLIDPILEYDHAAVGVAVVGGYVYRGTALPAFQGRYVFGDWTTSFSRPDGSLLVGTPPTPTGGTWSMQELTISTTPSGRVGAYVHGFGQDTQGELYVLTSSTGGPTTGDGQVWKIVPAAAK